MNDRLFYNVAWLMKILQIVKNDEENERNDYYWFVKMKK